MSQTQSGRNVYGLEPPGPLRGREPREAARRSGWAVPKETVGIQRPCDPKKEAAFDVTSKAARYRTRSINANDLTAKRVHSFFQALAETRKDRSIAERVPAALCLT